jgi:bifunctional DNase/RNase
MENDVIQVTPKGVTPTGNGCAVFFGNEEKTFIIYIDEAIGQVLSMALKDAKHERPLTHDLVQNIFLGLNVELKRVIINDVNNSTFYARIVLEMENELGKKIIEIDARPSDATVLAVQMGKPIYVSQKVFDTVEDMTEILERIHREKGNDDSDDDL